MLDCLFVGVGGFVGAVMRHLIGSIPLKQNQQFPVLTLLINIAGAFAIGFLSAYVGKNASMDPKHALFLKTGVCGGFTTFSTFSLEALTLFQNGRTGAALAYVLLSLSLGLAAAAGGCRIA